MDHDGVEVFEANRSRLFGIAYRMLGEAGEAEDVVQDAYLRWAQSTDVDVPAAWLTKVVTNLSLNRLTSARARRERYIGPWLPEPVASTDGALGPLDTVEQRDSISLGVLVLLERLTPAERAVFILREAFGNPYREIAEILSIDEAHARQLHRRARERVSGPDRRRFPVDDHQRHRIVKSLLAAVEDGSVEQLESLLAEDVEAWSDGGGRRAARRPVLGRDKVARFLLGLSTKPEVAQAEPRLIEANGDAGVAYYADGALVVVAVLEIVDGMVDAIRIVLNPDKLSFLQRQLAHRP